jgi:hypothetical protein
MLLALVPWAPVASEALGASPPLEVWLRVEGLEDIRTEKGETLETKINLS